MRIAVPSHNGDIYKSHAQTAGSLQYLRLRMREL